jgi:GNAT superfamily N-acetyltransferase
MTDDLVIRPARAADVPALVALLVDDPLGAQRESIADLRPYHAAFARIADDPNQLLVTMERNGEIIGTQQITFIPGLSFQGAVRAQIEAVRIRADLRGSGLGTRLIEWAIEEARRRGCYLVQLSSNNVRLDAHRFYTRLGFEASHTGFKRKLH